jgi:hypothetical protein
MVGHIGGVFAPLASRPSKAGLRSDLLAQSGPIGVA